MFGVYQIETTRVLPGRYDEERTTTIWSVNKTGIG